MQHLSSLSSSSPAHTPKEEYIIAKSEDSGELVGNHTEQPQSLGMYPMFGPTMYIFLHFSCILLFVSFEEDVVKSSATEPSPGPEHAGKEESSTWEEQLCAQQEQLEKEMQETRKMVSRLQVSYSYTFIWVFLQHQAFYVKLCKIIIILKNNNTFQIFGINSDNKDMLTKDFYIKDYWKKMVPQNH